MKPVTDQAQESHGVDVIVVGTCASGKSTLVTALREAGIAATACAQEHSEVASLWNHRSPRWVVYLEADLPTIRKRRSAPDWPETLYNEQLRRLVHARQSADLVIDTTTTSLKRSVELVAALIASRPDQPPPARPEPPETSSP